MRPIIAEIITLVHYQQLLDSESLPAPSACPHCGSARLWRHGHYERKPDREHAGHDSLNPVSIFRFYCPLCRLTCSVLPECICPRRWYLWSVQQAVLLSCLLGKSLYQTASQSIPSRWTIKRWWKRLKEQFVVHASCLKSLCPSLGYCGNEISLFWQLVLSQWCLSKAMLMLNEQQVIVP